MTSSIQNKFKFANIILFICTVCCLIYYDYHGGLWLKGVTSGWFVLLGLVNLIYSFKMKIKSKIVVLIFCGLLLGMCADVLLGINFIMGVLCFALGHVFYIISFFSIEKPKIKDLAFIVPIAIFAIIIVTKTPFIQVEDPFMQKLLVGYAVIISCMLGKALSNYLADKCLSRKIIALGSVMFMFSDLMLAVDMFGVPSRMTWILCSYTYWPAQCLLAVSMFLLINELKGESFKE